MTERATQSGEEARFERCATAARDLASIHVQYSVAVLNILLPAAQRLAEQPFDASEDEKRASHDELLAAIDSSQDFLVLHSRRDPHRGMKEGQQAIGRLTSAIAIHGDSEGSPNSDQISPIDLAWDLP